MDAKELHEWDIDVMVDLLGDLRRAFVKMDEFQGKRKKAKDDIIYLMKEIEESKKTIDNLETKL